MLAVHVHEQPRSTSRVCDITARLKIGMDTNGRFAMVPPALRTQTHSNSSLEMGGKNMEQTLERSLPMMRPFIWLPIAALAMFGGCQQGQNVSIDPFGRTTIPPPPTGAAAHRPGDSYYSGPGNAAPPLVPVGSTTQGGQRQANQNKSAPPNNWVSTAPSSEPSAASRLQPIPPYEKQSHTAAPIAATPSPPPPSGPIKTTGNETPLAKAAPPSSGSGLRWSGANAEDRTSAQPSTEKRTDLASLPKTIAKAPASDRSLQPTTNVTARRETTSVPPRYGHAKDYTRLQGRLEYVAVSRQWKLRYISAEGPMDAYGGCVLLLAGSQLEDFQAGDYVIVYGRLDQSGSPTGSDQTRYVITRIAPLR